MYGSRAILPFWLLLCSPGRTWRDGARATISERGADRIHNVLLATVFGESGALFGKPLLLVRRSYAVQQTQRISQRWSGAAEIDARRFAEPSTVLARDVRLLRQGSGCMAKNPCRLRQAGDREPSGQTACARAAVAQSVRRSALRRTPIRRRRQATERLSFGRSRRLPFSPCQTISIRSDLRVHRRTIKRAG
jgi:hypothetical protein